MKIIILLITVLVFSAYFYAIGAGYFALLPFFVFLVLVYLMISGNKEKIDVSERDNRYLFLGAWGVVNIALVTLLYFLGIGVLESLLGIIGLNILTLLLSYVIEIKYAKEISYIMYFLSILAVIGYAMFNTGMNIFLTVEYLLAFTTAFLAFLYFVVPLYYQTEKYIQIHFILSLFFTLGIVLYDSIPQKYYAIAILLALVLLILVGIHYIMAMRPKKSEKKNISIRKILAGERILPILEKKNSKNTSILLLQEFMQSLPQYAKYLLEFSNVLLLITFLYIYIVAIAGKDSSGENFSTLVQLGWIQRIIISLFLINIYMFKKIGYTSILQKIGMFLGVNIFVYIAIFSVFPEISVNIVMLAIVINIVYSIIVFNLEEIFPTLVRKKWDYLVASAVDVLVGIANIILIAYLPFSGQIIFAMGFLYVAVKVLIMLYTFNKIREKKLLQLQYEKIYQGKTSGKTSEELLEKYHQEYAEKNSGEY